VSVDIVDSCLSRAHSHFWPASIISSAGDNYFCRLQGFIVSLPLAQEPLSP
jgi:hypothetical protein